MSRRAKSWWSRTADAIGSVPFGVGLIVALLAYCWIGSAGTEPFYPWFVRQSLEMTEREWFSWWPFHLMIALLVVSLVLVTVRRIPFDLPRLGVWTVHAGVIVLVLGSAVYFGRKVESDPRARNERRRSRRRGRALSAAGRLDPARLRAAHG